MACFSIEVVMNDYKMTPGELRATWGLGTVFSLRMLGMFMVLPVLTTYGMALQGASEALIGLAIGIYGLAQAVFQIPFGLLSDRVGRKPLDRRWPRHLCHRQYHCGPQTPSGALFLGAHSRAPAPLPPR
jgi:MFS family permease